MVVVQGLAIQRNGSRGNSGMNSVSKDSANSCGSCRWLMVGMLVVLTGSRLVVA